MVRGTARINTTTQDPKLGVRPYHVEATAEGSTFGDTIDALKQKVLIMHDRMGDAEAMAWTDIQISLTRDPPNVG